ncbi:MAG: hypothetical protein CMH47_05055 [Muricauda sp.]|nr:hypothetical protein [Allomuricauda sp.]
MGRRVETTKIGKLNHAIFGYSNLTVKFSYHVGGYSILSSKDNLLCPTFTAPTKIGKGLKT